MATKSSSHRWLARQSRDPYVKQAQVQGYRSRAAYKLLEIDDQDHLLRPGYRVIDLGAAPGGWSQVAQMRVGPKGFVLAIDILKMDAIKGVQCVQGDFEAPTVLASLRQILEQRGISEVDLVISDMAPNLSGVRDADQAKALRLAEAAVDFAAGVLRAEGFLLVKLFQSADCEAYLRVLKQHFKQVLIRKPKASRSESREIYVVGKGYQAQLAIHSQ